MGKKIKLVVDVTELGRKGGKATAKGRTPEERKEASAKAISARWEKYYREHPEKLSARKARDLAKKRRTRRKAA